MTLASSTSTSTSTGHRLTASTAFACIGFLLSMLAGCGGGGSSTAPPNGNQSGAPVQGASADARTPYWASDLGVRPNLAHLFTNANSIAPVITLSGAEQAQVQQAGRVAALAAGTERKGALATAVQRRTVAGLSSIVFHSAAGSVQQPNNLTGATIEAIAPDGAGGFERIAATSLRSDGTYAITGVPEGPHWLRFGLDLVWTDAGFIDWSSEAFGRADVAGASLPTVLNINAGNLSPWQADDSLAWVVPQQGTSSAIVLTSTAVTNAPRLLDTALGDFGIDISTGIFSGALLDAGKGDQAYLNQLVTQPATGVRALARSMVLPALTTADGSTTPVTSGFLDIAPTASLKLRWNRSEHAAYAAAVNPSAVPSTSAIGVSAFALPPLFGTPSDAYSLVEFNTLGTNDIDFGRIRYGNPFPAEWNRVLDSALVFTARYLAPGATVPEPLERGIVSSELIDPGSQDDATVRLAPRITPARSPQINGKSLFANQLAVGTSPVLSWAVPAVGVPSQYFVRLVELSAVGTRSRLRTVGRLYTTATTLTVPPGLLLAGHLYVVTIAAIDSSSPITQPFRTTLPFSFATLMSAIVSP